MADVTIEMEICRQLERLAPEQQRLVLDFARNLAAVGGRGVAGAVLARFAGAINEADLTLISQAVDEGCERVNLDKW